MGVRVMEQKVLLALHLRHLDEESLAHRVYMEQLAMDWPGLACEVADICRELGIKDVNITKHSKYDYKKILSMACHAKNKVLFPMTTNTVQQTGCAKVKTVKKKRNISLLMTAQCILTLEQSIRILTGTRTW